MSSEGQEIPPPPAEGPPPISLDQAKVLQFDSQADSRAMLQSTLNEIGFRKIESCENIGQFESKLDSMKPDLVFVDIDTDREAACTTIKGVRNQEIGSLPFVVVVAMTRKPELDAVKAALGVGADDMVVKPVTAKALTQRVVNQIENRKEFIATDDYVGPDRRADDRELTDDDLAAIEVPNSLRHKATGDESAALSEDRIKDTMRNLSAQKFVHLSAKIGRIAAQQRDLLASNAASADHETAVKEITAALAEIDEIATEQAFKSVGQVVASTRRALDEIKSDGGGVNPRHFELLQVHGGSIGVVLKESDESAGILVTQLEKAVSAVKADPLGPKKEEPAKPEEQAKPAPEQPAPEQEAKPASNGAPPPMEPVQAPEPAPAAGKSVV